ncbi:hypothetical protein NP233_g7027 [Leucocoprinus birnbaumii]|uniref:Protein kinase domain-containing protein n=1 Tax=Leucocoprinus birnbaumii TaxID=56174 RepID=A0AAD5YPH0_9AGAR|nr:hypothetical protein NP233_g7027 [Leucocoprinus birnbaumii]
MPTLEGTYYPGTALDLYAWPQPAPHITMAPKRIKRTPTTRRERYNRSIAERVALPSTPPTVTITLEKRMESSMRRVAHVWSARVRAGATTTYPSHLVAKIYDPVFFDDKETKKYDPFEERDSGIAYEVESYRRLESLYETKVPRFYGYFAAMLPNQDSRTVFILLLEQVPGRDMCAIVPPKDAEKVCIKHKEAIVDAVLNLCADVYACGVNHQDMQPRNVILRPQKHASLSLSRTRFCDTEECLLALEVDCEDLHMVLVDFEIVEFKVDPTYTEEPKRTEHIKSLKPLYLECWLENGMV